MWQEYVLFYMCPDYAINKLSWWFPLIDLALILHRLISLETSNIRLKCTRDDHIGLILTYRRSREQFSLFWRHGTSGRNCKVVGNSSPVLDWGRRAPYLRSLRAGTRNGRFGCAPRRTCALGVHCWARKQLPYLGGGTSKFRWFQGSWYLPNQRSLLVPAQRWRKVLQRLPS